ncbi:hypothetical protein ACEUZ9_003038 [Paracoccus litorisediminis]|uniref:Uncharacterized protein n=1 Tax=Paracoccus litorisediminis TaxID=2006130 RepID=A0A844HNC9_9RHOB|nr:hypothetical protein [Paracoccus litorisediminis]MTH60589.1 hypothetical protein [Paracoccus litorisediminis]
MTLITDKLGFRGECHADRHLRLREEMQRLVVYLADRRRSPASASAMPTAPYHVTAPTGSIMAA